MNWTTCDIYRQYSFPDVVNPQDIFRDITETKVSPRFGNFRINDKSLDGGGNKSRGWVSSSSTSIRDQQNDKIGNEKKRKKRNKKTDHKL